MFVRLLLIPLLLAWSALARANPSQTIFIVDDHDSLREALEVMMYQTFSSRVPLQVVSLSSGEALIQRLARGQTPSLLVMDMSLNPVSSMNGLSTLFLLAGKVYPTRLDWGEQPLLKIKNLDHDHYLETEIKANDVLYQTWNTANARFNQLGFVKVGQLVSQFSRIPTVIHSFDISSYQIDLVALSRFTQKPFGVIQKPSTNEKWQPLLDGILEGPENLPRRVPQIEWIEPLPLRTQVPAATQRRPKPSGSSSHSDITKPHRPTHWLFSRGGS